MLNVKIYSIVKFIYLIKLLKNLKPDAVLTWLFRDFIGGIAARLAGLKNMTEKDTQILNLEKLNLLILIIKILSKLSFFIPKLIVVVSKVQKTCKKLGYKTKN